MVIWMNNKGNPHFMTGLRERRLGLLKKLRGVVPDEWDRILNCFALDNDLRIEKVREYFLLIKKVGYVDVMPDGTYVPLPDDILKSLQPT